MLDFYYVDENYIKYLQTMEKKVPNISYKSNNKFVCGIVMKIYSVNYYAPISHNTNSFRTSMIILSRKGNPISSIRFSFMFPAPLEALTKIDFSVIEKKDKKYADLLKEEYAFCAANEQKIRLMAEKVYKMGCNPSHF